MASKNYYVTPRSYDYKKHRAKVDRTVMTVQGEVTGIREILLRYKAGIVPPLRGSSNTIDVDFDDPDLEKFYNSDFVDKDFFIAQNKEKIEAVQLQLLKEVETGKALSESTKTRRSSNTEETEKENKETE